MRDTSPVRPLVLWPALRARLEQLALRSLPEECCGFLIGRRDSDSVEVQELVEARNVAASHRARRYVIDPQLVLAIHKRVRDEGRSIVGFYHSHPDGSTRPSRRDAANAWPEVSYVIVALGGLDAEVAWPEARVPDAEVKVTSWVRGDDGRMLGQPVADGASPPEVLPYPQSFRRAPREVLLREAPGRRVHERT